MASLAALASLLIMTQTPVAPSLSDATLGAAPPAGAIVLFDGSDLSGWVTRNGSPADWPVEDGAFTVGSGNIQTRADLPRDYALHIEFNVPLMPEARGQARGNSGIYLNGRYELQVLDSYGLDSKDNDCGGIYKQYAPAVNACKPPLQWQTYDIDWRGPRVVDGKVTANARITVRQNGQVIHDDVEVQPTPGGVGGPLQEQGPLLLQDHGNTVQYRNIWLTPRDA